MENKVKWPQCPISLDATESYRDNMSFFRDATFLKPEDKKNSHYFIAVNPRTGAAEAYLSGLIDSNHVSPINYSVIVTMSPDRKQFGVELCVDVNKTPFVMPKVFREFYQIADASLYGGNLGEKILVHSWIADDQEILSQTYPISQNFRLENGLPTWISQKETGFQKTLD